MTEPWLERMEVRAGNRQKDVRQARRSGNGGLQVVMRWAPAAAILCCAFIMLGISKAGGYIRTAPPLLKQLDQFAAHIGLGLQTISLSGFKITSDNEIFAALELENSQSLFGFDAHGARKQLEVLPWVRSVHIKQTFPHRLDISVQEHHPYALWISRDGEILVNQDGRQLAVVRAGAVRDLPVIEGPGAPQAARSLFRSLEHYPELSPTSLRAVRVANRRWTLILEDLRKILLPEEHYVQALTTLMAGHKGERLIDLNFQNLDLRNTGQIVFLPQLKSVPDTTSYHATHRKRALKG